MDARAHPTAWPITGSSSRDHSKPVFLDGVRAVGAEAGVALKPAHRRRRRSRVQHLFCSIFQRHVLGLYRPIDRINDVRAYSGICYLVVDIGSGIFSARGGHLVAWCGREPIERVMHDEIGGCSLQTKRTPAEVRVVAERGTMHLWVAGFRDKAFSRCVIFFWIFSLQKNSGSLFPRTRPMSPLVFHEGVILRSNSPRRLLSSCTGTDVSIRIFSVLSGRCAPADKTKSETSSAGTCGNSMVGLSSDFTHSVLLVIFALLE